MPEEGSKLTFISSINHPLFLASDIKNQKTIDSRDGSSLKAVVGLRANEIIGDVWARKWAEMYLYEDKTQTLTAY